MANIYQVWDLLVNIKCFHVVICLVLTRTVSVLWYSCSSLSFPASFAVSLAIWLVMANKIWKKWSLPLSRAEWINVSCVFLWSSSLSPTTIYYFKKSSYIEVTWHKATKCKKHEVLSLLRLGQTHIRCNTNNNKKTIVLSHIDFCVCCCVAQPNDLCKANRKCGTRYASEQFTYKSYTYIYYAIVPLHDHGIKETFYPSIQGW